MKTGKNGKIYSLLGLAQKAGKIKSGQLAVENSISARKAYLVIVPEDASDNTKKLYSDKCSYYSIPHLIFGEKDALGYAIGKAQRSAIAVEDAGFARALKEKIDGGRNYGED